MKIDLRRKKRPATPPKRVRSGDARVIRVGHNHVLFRDLYVHLLSMRWRYLIPLIAAIYLLINFIFAGLYYIHLDGIDQARDFGDAFYFSMQTWSTSGYGRMAPVTTPVNIMTVIEALVAFIYTACVTGLMFAKFSRPTARVLFSEKAVISNFEGKKHLKIRLANQRNNRIVDVSARLFLLRYSTTKEGFPMRRFIDLPVVRDHMPILRLTWTLMHEIDEDSPLYGMTQKDMENSDDEIYVTLVGLDETLSQTVHARHSYLPEEIIHDAYFEDVVKRNDASVELNYNKFHMLRFDTPNTEDERSKDERSNRKR